MENSFSIEKLFTDTSTNGTTSNIKMDSSTLKTNSVYERPRDPRDIKRSRAYQFENSLPTDKSSTTALLDSSILTPITNNDMLNGINVAGQRIDLPATLSDEAAVNLTDSSDTADVMVQETEMNMDIKPIFKIEDDGMEVELPDKGHVISLNSCHQTHQFLHIIVRCSTTLMVCSVVSFLYIYTCCREQKKGMHKLEIIILKYPNHEDFVLSTKRVKRHSNR